MKIAIQGHSTRGKEVIQILESLGGNNLYMMTGSRFNYYYINSYYNIDGNSLEFVKKLGYTIYTLEEFEREFPFKFGDKVIALSDNKPYKIIVLEHYNGKLCYKLDNGFHYQPRVLKPYKEMKEERNITLTLDKAKEWYKKGGELKEIALQAFTEKELNPLPRSWEEFCEKCRIEKNESYINSEGKILSFVTTSKRSWDNICPSKKSAEAHLAMIQLEQLRNCWRQGWEPDWNNVSDKYCIYFVSGDAWLEKCQTRQCPFAFPTAEMRDAFYEAFKEEIEICKELL